MSYEFDFADVFAAWPELLRGRFGTSSTRKGTCRNLHCHAYEPLGPERRFGRWFNQISETRSGLVGSTLRVTHRCALRCSSGPFPQSECVKVAGLDHLDLYVQFSALARVVPLAHRLPGREHEVVVSKKLSLKHVGGRKVLTFTKLHPKMVRTHPEMINQGAPVKPRIKSWERRAISAEFAKTSAVVRRPAGDNELGAIRFQSVRFRTATAANWAHPARLLDSQIVHPALRPRHLMGDAGSANERPRAISKHTLRLVARRLLRVPRVRCRADNARCSHSAAEMCLMVAKLKRIKNT